MSNTDDKTPLPFTRTELERIHIFRDVDLDLIEPFLRNISPRCLQSGEVLINAKQSNQSLYILLSGRLSIHVDSLDNAPVSKLEAGETVGEMSLFDELPASAFVVADTASRVLRIDKKIMWQLSEKSHAVSNNLLTSLSKRLRQFTDMVQQRNERLQEKVQALQESEERYTLAMRGANEGLWDWSVNQHTIYLSPHAILVFKLRPEQDTVADDEWLKRLHPEDHSAWHEALTAHLRGDKAYFTGEFRMLIGNEYRWTFCRGLGIRDADGHVYRMAGSITDITERKRQQAEQARIESELKVGREIQMSMLPLTFPAFPEHQEIDIFAMLEPAREVGGDLYDFFFIDAEHLCLCIGDVAGKGVPAALFMAVTKTLIKAKAKSADNASPASILTYVNHELSKDNPSCMFATLFVGLFNIKSGLLHYANAGHNPPYLLRNNGQIYELAKRHGPMAGIVEDLKYQESQIGMQPGDMLFMFTDGVTEAMDQYEQLFSDSRLLDLLTKYSSQSAEGLVKCITAEVKAFAGPMEASDDMTLLTMKFHGEQRIDNDK